MAVLEQKEAGRLVLEQEVVGRLVLEQEVVGRLLLKQRVEVGPRGLSMPEKEERPVQNGSGLMVRGANGLY